MLTNLQDLIAKWDGLAVVARYEREFDAWIFIAMHDDRLGSPVGGTRLKIYGSPAEGLRDAMRLAEGMTHKWAAIELGSGGGKAVLALSRILSDDERASLFLRYGALLNTLRGSFATGQDLGTTPEDMFLLSSVTPYVHGCDSRRNEKEDPGPYTARGVLAGIRSAVERVFDSGALEGRRILVEGVGGVGGPLARMCAEAGAELLIVDTDARRAGEIAAATGGKLLAGADPRSTECDVYAPCAVGATLDRETIPKLRCRAVAGSANNQLAEPEDADRLHRRGVLYGPDFVVNAGGALAFGLKAREPIAEEEVLRRVDGLGQLLGRIFSEAADRDESPLHSARRHIERVLARGRP